MTEMARSSEGGTGDALRGSSPERGRTQARQLLVLRLLTRCFPISPY